LWERADNAIKLRSYDIIVNTLQEWLAQSQLPQTLDDYFAPPAGLAEYRKLKAGTNTDKSDSGNVIERK
jgi:hypothetical protein